MPPPISPHHDTHSSVACRHPAFLGSKSPPAASGPAQRFERRRDPPLSPCIPCLFFSPEGRQGRVRRLRNPPRQREPLETNGTRKWQYVIFVQSVQSKSKNVPLFATGRMSHCFGFYFVFRFTYLHLRLYLKGSICPYLQNPWNITWSSEEQ